MATFIAEQLHFQALVTQRLPWLLRHWGAALAALVGALTLLAVGLELAVPEWPGLVKLAAVAVGLIVADRFLIRALRRLEAESLQRIRCAGEVNLPPAINDLLVILNTRRMTGTSGDFPPPALCAHEPFKASPKSRRNFLPPPG